MKKEELRIGNWYHSVKFGVPVRCDLSDLYNLSAIADGADDDPPINEMFEPIPLTADWLLNFGFEKWNIDVFTDYENHLNFCLHNIIDGTSDFQVYLCTSWYGAKDFTDEEILKHTEKHWGIKIDQDILYFYYPLEYVHQLQLIYFALTGKELMV